MALIDEILSENWNIYVDGKLTFYGVLDEYYDTVVLHWNEDTQRNYLRHYERFVLPDLNDKALEDCTREDFDRVILALPKRKADLGQEFNEGVERHIWVIIEAVLKAAEKHGVCPNVLWGSEYDISETMTEEELCEKELVRLRKSLTVPEELAVAERILQDPFQNGGRMGLALMFCLGLRNGEACGADFGDIHPMDCDPSVYCLWVYKTTAVGGNIQKFGGKTHNVSRVIPLPSALKALLEQRRKFLLLLAQSGHFAIDQNRLGIKAASVKEIVDHLPIACVSTNYTKRCSAAILTREGTVLLKKVSMPEDMLAYINRDIRRPGRTEEGILEKDPTAYLFRRNLGTHLYLLGLEDSEIQYIIGHEIEESGEERSFFRNEEKLYQIAQKMALRPIVNDTERPNHVELEGSSFLQKDVYRKRFVIPVEKTASRIRARISQREPGTEMKVRLCPDQSTISGTHIQYQNEGPYEPVLTVMGQYWERYRLMGERVDSGKEGVPKSAFTDLELTCQKTLKQEE